MIEGLTFEPEGHVYTYKGQRMPSVTQVLQPLQHLQGIPWEILEAAADFGRNVHAAVHLFNQDDLDEDSLSEPLVPYLAQYKRFLSETGFKVEESEGYVVNPLMGYCGQWDFRGKFRNTTWVVDVKTTAIVPSTVGAQTAAYQNAMIDKPRKRACLHLGEHSYKFLPQENLGDWSLFISALNIFKFNAKHNRGMTNDYR